MDLIPFDPLIWELPHWIPLNTLILVISFTHNPFFVWSHPSLSPFIMAHTRSQDLEARLNSCWITERGGESIINQFNPFNHNMQVLFIFMINIILLSNHCRLNKTWTMNNHTHTHTQYTNIFTWKPNVG
jgi:hypothetical protein